MFQPFAVSVLPFPKVRLFGIRVKTDLDKAPVDCPALWRAFTPRMPELSGKPAHLYQGPSYGVSIITDKKGAAFTYWAAMEARPQSAPPQGMGEVVLHGGLYACCRIPAAGMLQEAYDYMYDEWPRSAEGFPVLVDQPCFEYYSSRFCQSGTHEVYVPILPR